ncbi:TPA: hypothetical protein I7750_16620 [Vibrio vulnificus]|nr:hypothetical protein [Vibrio vulnificus]
MDLSTYQFDAFTQQFYHFQEKQILSQGTLLVPGGGCVYWRSKKGAACTFCSFPQLTKTLNGSRETNYRSWALKEDVYKAMLSYHQTTLIDCQRLAIFNGGSFFPRTELPISFQEYVFDYVSRHHSITELLVECYPNFIHKVDIIRAIEQLNGKQLVIGIGFESQDDHIRNHLLNKGISKQLFEQKVTLLKTMGVKVYVYVFLKAPGVSEIKALHEALDTISYLVELGVDEIALSCAFVSENTPLEREFLRDQFIPPTLWSIAEILYQAKHKGWPLSLGRFHDTPAPIAIPANCERCSPMIYDIFEHYRVTGEFEIQSMPKCDCKNAWLNENQLHLKN